MYPHRCKMMHVALLAMARDGKQFKCSLISGLLDKLQDKEAASKNEETLYINMDGALRTLSNEKYNPSAYGILLLYSNVGNN